MKKWERTKGLSAGRRCQKEWLEVGISRKIHCWKYSWLRLQDDNLNTLHRLWLGFQYQLLGASLELADSRRRRSRPED